MTSYKILGLIPARGGSKGVPGKNIKMLGGKPLISYTIQSALESTLIQDVIVSTDSAEIKEIAIDCGANVPFLRPPELSNDSAKSIDVVLHALEYLKQKGKEYDAIILLQPTTPFRPKGFIDEAISLYKNKNYDSLVSVLSVPDEYNPHWVYEVDEKGFLKLSTGEQEIISRRQELPKAFIRDGSVYITSTDVVNHSRSFYGNKLGYIISDEKFHVNIDTPLDWERAETLFKIKK
jgi:CMP-N,N'-diacetyllegionaminic acid synthase